MSNRQNLVEAFRSKIEGGRAILGSGVGTGLSARCAESAGLDFLVVYNSGRYRMAGRSSMAGLLPYGDANAIVMDMATEILPVVRHTPVIAGVCGTDPFRLMPKFLREVKEAGFKGVQNYPTVARFDGTFRLNLEETGLGFDREVEMISIAADLDLLTVAYVTTISEIEAMTRAGADLVVPHVGVTASGLTGAKTTLSLTDAIAKTRVLAEAAIKIRPNILVLCHGGPIVDPTDAATVIESVESVVGFLGASSMERLPTETAMVDRMRQFVEIST